MILCVCVCVCVCVSVCLLHECLGACKWERLVWPYCMCRMWAEKRVRSVGCLV